MAVIVSTQVTNSAPYNATRTTLSASDTMTYVGNGQELHLYNITASSVTVTLTGSAATTISPVGYGGTISVATGKAVIVPAGTATAGHTVVPLDSISAFLAGTITVTGGVGVVAMLLNN
jgi:uncharacterized protein YjlB